MPASTGPFESSDVPRYDFTSPRLFVDHALHAGGTVPLGRQQSHYLGRVLRLGAGDAVLVFNGRDGEWRAALAGDRGASALALAEQTRLQPPPIDLDYCFAPLKHARLDYLVQKAVEMGAGFLQPVITRRTQVARVNIDRVRSNAVEAAEQCGILAIPSIGDPLRFDELVARWPAGRLMVFCDEDAEVADPLAALRGAGASDGVSLIVGPEGGFDEAERRALLSLPNRVRISLGSRILRADTAAVAALALVQATLGDWRDPVAASKDRHSAGNGDQRA